MLLSSYVRNNLRTTRVVLAYTLYNNTLRNVRTIGQPVRRDSLYYGKACRQSDKQRFPLYFVAEKRISLSVCIVSLEQKSNVYFLFLNLIYYFCIA